ncbi:hypothetical protein NDU88_001503 [Pleurodeles waltl]|uniref:Uncharacterized protein n=1 Tax=Pleurodeles waltl TaxID=8319 RepID=A0AAV7UUX1_PLEWA|nr:hypothetical protein NDU88_001503 [Pleurodeles waltl]
MDVPRVAGERDPAFTQEELEKLVDGVLPRYAKLCGRPEVQDAVLTIVVFVGSLIVVVYDKEQGWHDLQLSIHGCRSMFCGTPVRGSLYLVHFRLALCGGGSRPGTGGGMVVHNLMGRLGLSDGLWAESAIVGGGWFAGCLCFVWFIICRSGPLLC